MKFVLSVLIPVLGLVVALPGGADAQQFIKDTKHNLSSAGTSSIRSDTTGGTTEICVFCHTPHSASKDAPLWNRAASIQTYATYTSDVLAALTYYPAEDPSNPGATGYGVHVKSRICLSCHDGTIALGNLVNLPSGLSSDVKMVNANADGTMPTSAAGYIGIDLQDDHPIAIPHDRGRDQELKASITGGKIYLYQAADGQKTNTGGPTNYVECTSCHNAHDNTNGYFLVEPNTGSALCTDCHSKVLGAATPAHDTSGVGYDPDGTGKIGTTVAAVKCMNCHYSHKAGIKPSSSTANAAPYGRYLLSFQEEGSCFNYPNRWNRSINVCHASSATKDIQTQEAKPHAHNGAQLSGPYSGKHQATEAKGYSWLGAGNANWHVDCNDCHNSHTAGNTKHAAPGNIIANASPLYGTGGVSVSWAGSWPSVPGSSAFTYFESLGLTSSSSMPINYYEYQICLKCHSNYAWGAGSPPDCPSLKSLDGGLPKMTDQAKEFNPGNTYPNYSMHPVAGPTGNTVWAGALLGNWAVPANKGNQTMFCSDCHGTNDGVAPQGPHGSINYFLLKSAFTDTYTAKGTVQTNGELCFACHEYATYAGNNPSYNASVTGFSGGTTNLHTQHVVRSSASSTSAFGYMCVNCHARVTHGYGRKGMIVLLNDGAPYEAGGTGAGKIQTFSPASSGAYLVGLANINASCSTVAGCHH